MPVVAGRLVSIQLAETDNRFWRLFTPSQKTWQLYHFSNARVADNQGIPVVVFGHWFFSLWTMLFPMGAKSRYIGNIFN